MQGDNDEKDKMPLYGGNCFSGDNYNGGNSGGG
jgi:hypothetical protein